MPWNGGDGTPGIFPSLGHAVAEFIESNVIIPDGERMGDPYILTDEQYMHLLHAYRLVPNARDGEGSDAFRFSGALLVRPQKWGKLKTHLQQRSFAPKLSVRCVSPVGTLLASPWGVRGLLRTFSARVTPKSSARTRSGHS
jgi:hypothetical protein